MKLSFYLKLIFFGIYLIFYFLDYSLYFLHFALIFFIVFFFFVLLFFRKYFLNYFSQIGGFLVLLFAFYFLVYFKIQLQNLNEKKEEKNFITQEEYEFLKKIRYDHTFYGNVRIKKVLYPGMYISEVVINNIQVYKNKKKYLDQNYEAYKNKIIISAVQIPKKDLWEGCQIDIQFYGKVFFYKIEPKNGFYEFLLQNNGEYYFKLLEKNIKNYHCEENILNFTREKIVKIIENSILTEKQKQIALGLILGNSNWMDKIYKEEIKKLGLMHLFAASGLHLGILYFVLYFPLSKIFGRKSLISFLIPLPILYFYLSILEFPYTLVRAYIFYGIYSLQMIFNKKSWVGDLLINTLILMIFIFPFSVMNLSTILSFLSVSGILLFYNSLKDLFVSVDLYPNYNWKEKFKNWIYKFFIEQFLLIFSASIFLQPVLMYVFRGYSLLSPLYNMFFVPYVSLLLPYLFFMIIFDFLFSEFLVLDFLRVFLWNLLKILNDFLIFMLEFSYKTVLWIDFPNSVNSGFVISLSYLVFFLGFYYYFQKKSSIQSKYIILISFSIYQLFYFLFLL